MPVNCDLTKINSANDIISEGTGERFCRVEILACLGGLEIRHNSIVQEVQKISQ